jgi:hypothetical protein
MSSFAECISLYKQTDPSKFGLPPASTEATPEMIDVAEKVVYALVNARHFIIGFGCNRDVAREQMLMQKNSIINGFVDVVKKSPKVIEPSQVRWVQVTCENLTSYTSASSELINQFAHFSGYKIHWKEGYRSIVSIHPIVSRDQI